MNQRDLSSHEHESCDYRPVRICHNGCNLVILHRDEASHNCIEALRSHITSQEVRISSLQADIKDITTKHGFQEKTLHAKMTNLHNEIQQQALGFQKKLKDYVNRIAYLSKNLHEQEKVSWVS